MNGTFFFEEGGGRAMFSDLFHVETQLLIFTLINSKILLMNLLLGLKPLIFAPSFYKSCLS